MSYFLLTSLQHNKQKPRQKQSGLKHGKNTSKKEVTYSMVFSNYNIYSLLKKHNNAFQFSEHFSMFLTPLSAITGSFSLLFVIPCLYVSFHWSVLKKSLTVKVYTTDFFLFVRLKWYYDQKIISFFSSDFESVFAKHPTGKILSFVFYPKAVYFECKF